MTNAIPANIRVAVDIGGTFTDVVGQLPDGQLQYLKVPSTPDDPGQAVVTGLMELLHNVTASATSIAHQSSAQGAAAQTKAALARVSELIHGTTVGSNTLLQKTGAITGLLTTEGFRDVLEIARIRTPTMFDLTWRKPEPLASRGNRLEVRERMGADGLVVTPLEEEDVLRAGAVLVANGVEAVAICFINSYINAEHERQTKFLLEKHFPELLISASCDVLPEIKEYERTSTTVVNAYLLKAMRGYLDQLTKSLMLSGLKAPLRVVTSQGGMVSISSAAQRPVLVVGSGPAAGVVGGAHLAGVLGTDDLIVFDLGGTTAKASVVEQGRPALTTEYEFRDGMSSPSRFVKGGGYVLKVPAVDIAEVGAGGGSIAWVDAGGLLKVGPTSAGAAPGPACYGLGNLYPTLTDANVVLGYLNPGGLVGGSLGIDPALSAQAIEQHIAQPLGLSLVAAAAGIRRIANLEMARAIRSVTVERGKDPRDMTLLAAGGGGPVHAAELAELLGIGQVVIAPLPGVFCSLGMLSTDTTHAFVRSAALSLDQYRSVGLDAPVQALRDEATQRMLGEGVPIESVNFEFSVDGRYVGQSSELSLAFTEGMSADELYENFTKTYQRTFGHATSEPMEIANVRLIARSRNQDTLRFSDMHVLEPPEPADSFASPTRSAVFGIGDDYQTVPVHRRAALTDQPLVGPAIIDAYDTTVVLPPNSRTHLHATGALVIEMLSA
jgi:N-methylhydantoinase A